jgi:RNA polymerase sigma-70 factor (ECF subfamily)
MMDRDGRSAHEASSSGFNRSHAESRLLCQLRSRDQQAFERVDSQYRSRLHRTAFHILKNTQDAEDAVQEALFRAFVNIDSFNGRSSLSTWLMRILINCCLAQLRKSKRQSAVSLDEPGEEGNTSYEMIASNAVAADTAVIVGEQASVLRQVVLGLRSDFQFILTARSVDDLSLNEIALRLGLSVSATKSRALRAKRQCIRNVRRLTMPSNESRNLQASCTSLDQRPGR